MDLTESKITRYSPSYQKKKEIKLIETVGKKLGSKIKTYLTLNLILTFLTRLCPHLNVPNKKSNHSQNIITYKILLFV